MANLRGIIGFNPSSGNSRLLAAFGQDVVDVSTGLGYKLNLTDTSSNVEFETFLDSIFIQNGVDQPRNFDKDSNTWKTNLCSKMPISKYMKGWKSRLYLGYCTIPYVTTEANSHIWDDDPMEPRYTSANALTKEAVFPNRVFYSDLPKSNNTLTWGLYWSRLLSTVPPTDLLSNQISLSAAKKKTFKSVNLKVGDPVTFTDFAQTSTQFTSDNRFLSLKIDSDFRLTINQQITGIRGDSSGWIGSNWFDVAPHDGDVITGFGENSDRFLIFKLLSLWYYTGSQLKQINGAVGTSSKRSIINDQFGNTYYFHGSNPKISGIYKLNGVSAVKISRGIDPWIQAMSASSYSSVIAWKEGNELRWFIGNLTANNIVPDMTNVVVTFNVDTGAWSVDPIADAITASTTWIVNNDQDSYLGTSDSQVIQTDDGYSYNGSAISSRLETKVFYPSGSELINDMLYAQVIGRNTKGVRLKYKLWNDPELVDQEYSSLGELNNDKTEFRIPTDHYQASGISWLVEEMGIVENDWYIEKISLFYKPDRTRLL